MSVRDRLGKRAACTPFSCTWIPAFQRRGRSGLPIPSQASLPQSSNLLELPGGSPPPRGLHRPLTSQASPASLSMAFPWSHGPLELETTSLREPRSRSTLTLRRGSPRLREKGVILQAGCVWSRGGVFKAHSAACADIPRRKAEEIRVVCTCDKLTDSIYGASWRWKGKNQSTWGSRERTLILGGPCLVCVSVISNTPSKPRGKDGVDLVSRTDQEQDAEARAEVAQMNRSRVCLEAWVFPLTLPRDRGTPRVTLV